MHANRILLGPALIAMVVVGLALVQSGPALGTPSCGTNFSRVASPDVGTGNNVLRAVSVPNSGSPVIPFAVGYSYNPATHVDAVLVMDNPGHGWQIMPASNPSGKSNVLNAVVAISNTNVWAFGTSTLDQNGDFVASYPLAEHWNGTTWSTVQMPSVFNPSALDTNPADTIFSAAFVPPNHLVVAGGWEDRATFLEHPLVYDEVNGKFVVNPNTPSPGSNGSQFFSVFGLPGPTPAFYFGGEQTNSNSTQNSILFTRPEAPSSKFKNFPVAVDPGGITDGAKFVFAKATDDVWIAMNRENQNGFPLAPVLAHWDGTRWHKVTNSGVGLNAGTVVLAYAANLSADQAKTLYAGGASGVQSFQDPTLIEKLTPTTMTKETAPSPGAAEDILYGGASRKTAQGTNVWFVGDYKSAASSAQRTFIVQACGL